MIIKAVKQEFDIENIFIIPKEFIKNSPGRTPYEIVMPTIDIPQGLIFGDTNDFYKILGTGTIDDYDEVEIAFAQTKDRFFYMTYRSSKENELLFISKNFLGEYIFEDILPLLKAFLNSPEREGVYRIKKCKRCLRKISLNINKSDWPLKKKRIIEYLLGYCGECCLIPGIDKLWS